MKGGITSGLVYPKAVCRIGKTYRFRNIGGTSAGAIAAALSAAAALGERRIAASKATTGGLAMLEQTAAWLCEEGSIFSLFQPVKKARVAFALLVRLSAGRPRAILGVVPAVARLAPLKLVLTFLFFELIAFWIGGMRAAAGALLPSAIVAFAVATAAAVIATAKVLQSNFLGLCPGTSQDGKIALTEWMHEQIRLLAGQKNADGPPVTFKELWKAPPYPGEKPFAADERVLNLEVISTDASHSEPRTLPFVSGTLWFLRADMDRLFPKAVVDWMVDHGKHDELSHGGRTYHALPAGEDLPIVVAARMSLSFPLLISAVPLYEQHFLKNEDRSRPAEVAQAAKALVEDIDDLASAGSGHESGSRNFEMRICWFTDGGVSSNFPIHLFDAPMPRWPTFAIDLVYPPSGQPAAPDPIFLPKGNNQGWRPRYTPISGKSAVGEVTAFLAAIVATMQNWRDLLQGRAPGHRERIVQVEILSSEGGMNLNMSEPVLTALAGKGEAAGDRLANEFDFENHYWVRYRNLQASLERFGIRLDTALKAPPQGAEQAYSTALVGEGEPPSYRYTAPQSDEAVRRLKELLEEFEDWADWDGILTEGAPKPPPHLRIVPIF
jgi:hypothetical protein